jgi:hypothetical protein
MGAKAESNRPAGRPLFKIGDRVRLRLGLHDAQGTIVEDRGLLGAGGRRLYALKLELDPPNGTYTEMPEDELTAVQ